MIGALPKPCHPEARVLCEPGDLCNLRGAMRLRANCIGPSVRRKGVPQNDKNLESKFERLEA